MHSSRRLSGPAMFPVGTTAVVTQVMDAFAG